MHVAIDNNFRLLILAVFLGYFANIGNTQEDSLWTAELNTVWFAESTKSQLEDISISERMISSIAASFDDPVRILSRYPGYVTVNDQSNQISFRGMPAHWSTWLLNGVEIVNPNHLMGAGTPGDKLSFGGGVSMISGTIIDRFKIDQSPFLKNGFNNLSTLPNYNLDESLATYIKLSVIGLESGTGWVNNGWSISANYRYSFTGLLSDLGVDFGNESIKYQDAYLGIKKVTKKALIEFNGIYGRSSNTHIPLDSLTEDFTYKDVQDIRAENETFITSLKLNYQLGSNWLGELTSNFSSRSDTRIAQAPINIFDKFGLDERRFASRLVMSKGDLSFGAGFAYRDYILDYEYLGFTLDSNVSLSNAVWSGFIKDISKFNGFTVKVNFGIDYHSKNKKAAIPFAISFEKKFGGLSIELNNSIQARYPEVEILFFGQQSDVELIKSRNHEISIKLNSSANPRIGLFFHQFENVPTYSNWSAFNGVQDFLIFAVSNSKTKKARSYGVFGSCNYEVKPNDFWIYSNISFLRAQYQSQFSEEYSDAIGDYRWILNLNLKKTLFSKKEKLFQVLVSTVFRNGGNQYRTSTLPYYVPEYGVELYRISDYFRGDLRLIYKKRRSEFSLDIQNVTSRRNEGYQLYNFISKEFEDYDQLGIIPVLSWKLNIGE